MVTFSSPKADARERCLGALGQLPPFSPVLNRLVASLAKEDVSYAEIAGWIEKDTVLAGQVLRLVNSAAYARRGTVSSVRHAVSLLGVLKLRNFALSLSVARMWARVKLPDGWSIGRFNLHSAAAAILSDLLLEYIPCDYGEGAFVAGLLHDLGKLLMATGMPAEFATIQRVIAGTGRASADVEIEILGVTHAALSAEALARWNLPFPIQDAVAQHHGDTAKPSLAHIVRLADSIAHDLGITFHLHANPEPEDLPGLFAVYGLRDCAEAVVHDFRAEFEAMRSHF